MTRIAWNKGKTKEEYPQMSNSGVKRGNVSPNKGKRASLALKEKLRLAHLGQRPSDEAIEKARQFHLGKPGGMLGKTHSPEAKEKISKSHLGNRAYQWKGGLPKCLDCNKQLSVRNNKTGRCRICAGILRRKVVTDKRVNDYLERRRFRSQIQKSVFERDNYTCQMCGVRGEPMQVDHIQSWAEYVEFRFEMKNCRTLCMDCHYLITFGKPKPKDIVWGHNFGRRVAQ